MIFQTTIFSPNYHSTPSGPGKERRLKYHNTTAIQSSACLKNDDGPRIIRRAHHWVSGKYRRKAWEHPRRSISPPGVSNHGVADWGNGGGGGASRGIPTSTGAYRRASASARVANILEAIRGDQRLPRVRCVPGKVGRESKRVGSGVPQRWVASLLRRQADQWTR